MDVVIYNAQKTFVTRVEQAQSFAERFWGLMGRKLDAVRGGLLLKNCSSVHCFFMRFSIDVVYLDDDFYVVDKQTIDPWRIGKFVRRAKHVLELPEGRAVLLRRGDRILIDVLTKGNEVDAAFTPAVPTINIQEKQQKRNNTCTTERSNR